MTSLTDHRTGGVELGAGVRQSGVHNVVGDPLPLRQCGGGGGGRGRGRCGGVGPNDYKEPQSEDIMNFHDNLQ